MSNFTIGLITALVSLVVSFIVYPWVLRFARSHDIVDNPNARKLQRRPVPVMGGALSCGAMLWSMVL